MENKKTPPSGDLVGELLEGILSDVKKLTVSVSKLASEDDLDKLAKTVSSLENRLTTAPPATPAVSELAQVREELSQVKQLIRQRPDYTMSQYVRYGGYMFGLMVVLVAGLTWLALDWKGERDQFRAAYWTADWRVRYLKQQDPNFYSYIEGLFAKDPAGVSKWVVEQEQADEKRSLAAQAAEQAKALSDQANQLEGKPRVKGKKKG
jgi:BMFP domain-containing protein YqiC